jgi:DNA-binding MarR family transcriptional regulator
VTGTRFASPWQSPGFLLWHASLQWQRQMRRALEPMDLTHVQFVLLASTWWLRRGGDHPSQRELADQAGTDPMMTSQVCRALEAKGLIARNADPDDSRIARLRLTPAGEALAPTAVEAVETADREFFARVDDQEGLVALLSGLVSVPRAEPVAGGGRTSRD